MWNDCNVLNTLRQRLNYHYFADDIFKCILSNENIWISLKISLKCVPNFRLNNTPALVHTRRQAIICTIDGLGYWHIYASLGPNEPQYWPDSLTHICGDWGRCVNAIKSGESSMDELSQKASMISNNTHTKSCLTRWDFSHINLRSLSKWSPLCPPKLNATLPSLLSMCSENFHGFFMTK